MKTIGNQKVKFILDASTGKARTLRKGGRRGWPMFNDLLWYFLDGHDRVAVTVQRKTNGRFHVRPNADTEWSLDVYCDGWRLGRICREVFVRLFGPIDTDGVRFIITRKVVRK